MAATRRAGTSQTRPRGDREKTEARILGAAEAVFAERGFAGATIAEMVERSQIARGTFYLYFTNKHSVFVELVERATADLYDIVAPARGLDYRERIRRSTRSYMSGFLRHRGVLRCLFESSTSDPELLRIMNDHRMTSIRRVAVHLKRGVERGDFTFENPMLASYCLCALIEGAAYQWVCARNHPTSARIEDMDELVDEIATIWCAYVEGSAARLRY